MSENPSALQNGDYAALADFRAALRIFLAFSEGEAVKAGLSPRQHQALLAIRGVPRGEATVGYLAQRLILRPHTVSELVKRLSILGLLESEVAHGDRRKLILHLTPKAEHLLQTLSAAHQQEIRRIKPMLADLLDRFG
ncbi:MarR family winged helix-turn-helix transcriptional regulator [Sphingopyxis terrae]|uniref:MarR family winged helix-turn-helix transcriptional regulator n=1 Tax=Sphingopyxis terrae TaxID=33052 RepID=UPI003F81D94E